MTYLYRSVMTGVVAVVIGGCAFGKEPAGAGEAVTAIDLDPYVGHQGRLLLGFRDAEIRSFAFTLPVGNPWVDVANGELLASGMSGTSFAGVQFTAQAAVGGAIYEMRIAEVVPPDPNVENSVWEYQIEQRAGGAWIPACAEPAPIFPQPDPERPARAIAMQGGWTYWGQFVPNTQAVTFACRTGVAGKCDIWGYPMDAQYPSSTINGTPVNVTAANMLQACTRMARADYCGRGVPNTLDGTPIVIDDVFRERADVKGFEFEAAWTAAIGSRGRSSALCLTKLRWSTLPLDGGCEIDLPDPRTRKNGKFCEDYKPHELEELGARLYSQSSFLDVGLYEHAKAAGTGPWLTTSRLIPSEDGTLPEWLSPPPSGIDFPQPGQPVRLGATIFTPALADESTAGLLKLLTWKCPDSNVTTNETISSTKALDGCQHILFDGWVYPPNTPERTPLRRWVHPTTQWSLTTTAPPTQMIDRGFQLAEIVGGVLRGEMDVVVRWSAITGATAELEVQDRLGTWIPCFSSAQLANKTTETFRGRCDAIPGAPRRVNRSEIAAFRVKQLTQAGRWSATVPYDGAASEIYLDVGSSSRKTAVAVRWGEPDDPEARFAIDVRKIGSTQWERCQGPELIGNERSRTIATRCPSAGTSLDLSVINRVRVCAIHQSERCRDVAYSGQPALSITW